MTQPGATATAGAAAGAARPGLLGGGLFGGGLLGGLAAGFIGAGLFGGEGFIMERIQGDRTAFIHAGGTLINRDLAPGEVIKVDTGCIVAFTRGVDFDIQFVGGIKSALFGGEGLFFATLRGPGRIWLQSLPLSRLADRLYAAARHEGGRSREEGSILGGLGRLIDGDNR
jgi:hypothetical protein